MNKNKNIGLYFGTFNPIHIGHLIIANHLAEFTELDEVWLVITPQNPFKKNKRLLPDYHRYQMVDIALEEYKNIKPSKAEFDMPRPNYTSKTLLQLEESYTDVDFNLIIGEDNLASFNKWKNFEHILKNYKLYVCPRISSKEISEEFRHHENITWTETPIINISSTYIRKCVSENKNFKPLLHYGVWKYIDEMNFYK